MPTEPNKFLLSDDFHEADLMFYVYSYCAVPPDSDPAEIVYEPTRVSITVTETDIGNGEIRYAGIYQLESGGFMSMEGVQPFGGCADIDVHVHEKPFPAFCSLNLTFRRLLHKGLKFGKKNNN